VAWADLKDPADPQVGYVGGMQIPAVEQFIVGYENGARFFNESKGKAVQVKGGYVGDFISPEKGKELGHSLIDEGVDVILVVGGESGNGALAAAKERGKWGVGVDMDQYYTLPNERDILLTSAMKRGDTAVQEAVKALVLDKFGGGETWVLRLEFDGVGLAPYHDFEDQIPGSIKEEVDMIKQGIIDGTIKTGWPLP
jgi:basic membrane protein A